MKVNTLELKHLAPYLPYGLRIDISYYNDEDDDYKVSGSYDYPIVTGVDIRFDNLVCYYSRSSSYGIDITQEYAMEHIKPILRPLSDLTKEIEVNGEKFVPKDKLFLGDKSWINFKSSIKKYALHCEPYWIIQKLYEWHFDVFGLIEEGLAIDINTL